MPWESGDRYVCTKDEPWSEAEHGNVHVIHHDAVRAGDGVDYGLGCYKEPYKCQNCGKYFEVELPQ
jgi:hypothetical protein